MYSIPNLKYKTTFCNNWKEGTPCDKGPNCYFAHGDSQLRNLQENQQIIASRNFMYLQYQPINNFKTVYCKFYMKGQCKLGASCTFAHQKKEKRKMNRGYFNQPQPMIPYMQFSPNYFYQPYQQMLMQSYSGENIQLNSPISNNVEKVNQENQLQKRQKYSLKVNRKKDLELRIVQPHRNKKLISTMKKMQLRDKIKSNVSIYNDMNLLILFPSSSQRLDSQDDFPKNKFNIILKRQRLICLNQLQLTKKTQQYLCIFKFKQQQLKKINIHLILKNNFFFISNEVTIFFTKKQQQLDQQQNEFIKNQYQMKTNTNSNTLNPNNQTMYNLHTKRTLPRDVIKWMQGLDLSYSVKDYRKDMINGFLIAQIISRYQPGRIPMHAFQNSQNQGRKDNNWNQLHLFFSKHSIRGIQISSQEYNRIKDNDPKSQYLYNFICRLYSICTKRSIPQNAPILDLPPTQNNNPNLTTSYLLRDQGLQKLDNSGIHSNNASQLQHSGFSQKVQDRVPTRKIAANIQNVDFVDATGVGIKAEGRKMTSKRKSWNVDHQDPNNQQEQNAQNDRLIFDYIHAIMQECLPTQDPTIRQLLFPESQKFNVTQIFLRNILSIDPQYVKQVISQLNLSVQQLIPIILRQINQTWKFFVYWFKVIRTLNDGTSQFDLAIQMISIYAAHCHNKQPKRLAKVFHDSLLTMIISQVKLATSIRKKNKIMQIVYNFSGRQVDEKKNVLAKLKDELGSSNPLYIQWLAILVKQQVKKDKLQSKLLDDYIYYAQQFITSSTVVLRTSALKILCQISKSNCNLIQKYFVGKAQVFRNGRGDPQQVYLFTQIYYNILKQIIQSKQYQSLVKGVGSNNLVKAYNPDNQKNAQQLKNRINTIAQTIKILSQGSANDSVRQISAKKSVNYLQQSKHMMQIFLNYLYTLQNKQAFFDTKSSIQHQFKSFNVNSNAINYQSIKDYSNEILIQIICLKTNSGYQIQQFLYLINICLEYLNIKKINMQFWQDVSLHIVKPYCRLLVQMQYSKKAQQGLIKIFNIYFNYDMKIRQMSQWISDYINDYNQNSLNIQKSQNYTQNLQQKKQYINNSITNLNDWLNQQYQRNKNQIINFVINQISDNLNQDKNTKKKIIYLKH